MAYKPPLEEGELHSMNIKSIRSWIERNKNKIKAGRNKSLLYSGRDYDLEVLEDMKKEKDREEFMGTPMYKVIDRLRKDLEIPCDLQSLQTLPDILASIRDYPTIVDRDRKELRFSNANECFQEIKQLKKLLPNAKGVSEESWGRLSEIFASNSKGDIRILDGAADDYGKLRKDKDLLKKELPALLKNDNLSDEAKKLVMEKVQKYGSEFDRRYTKQIARLHEHTKHLKKG